MSERRNERELGDNPNHGFSDCQLEMLSGMLKEALGDLTEKVNRLEVSTSGVRTERPRIERRRHFPEYDEEENEESQNENWDRNRRGRDAGGNRRGALRGRYHDGGREDGNMGSIKMKIPSFHGKSDPEAYLDWEKRVESVFDCHHYSELKKVRLAVVEFLDYALIWWDQVVATKRKYNERPIETWDEMKVVMRKRFVPNHYYREMFKKLQSLRQGTKSVEDYYKEMEVAMIRTNIEEDHEATMARFLCGLNREIQDQVELRHYMDLDEMVQMSIKVEQQLRRKGVGRTSQPGGSSSTWRPSATKREDNKVTVKPKFEPKPEVPKPSVQGKSETPNGRTRDIKCFRCQGLGHYASQCPNKRAMFMNARGEYESESDRENNDDDDEMPELEDPDEGYEAVIGESLVTRRIMSTLVKDEETNQRENLFHTRCFVNKKVCNVIIDGGSCTNVASVEMVEKLNLPTLRHPQPYRLQWLNDSAEVRVTKQVLVSLSIGEYVDEVLCDVVPMQACHILLGRPWQYDRRAFHDGFKNKYSFTLRKESIVLLPLSPKQVLEDHLKKKERELAEKKSDKKGEVATKEEKERKIEKAEKKRGLKSEMANERKKERKENERKEAKKNVYMAQRSELKDILHTREPLVLLMYKEVLLNTSDIAGTLPSNIVFLLQEFDDVFPEELPQGLPPLRGIEHQIDLVPGSALPNRPAYRSNPEETKELQRQVLCSAWKDDGTTVFSGGCDKQVKMWPLLTGGQPVTVAMHDAPVKELAWVPEMNLLVTGSFDKTIRYWDLRQQSPTWVQQLPERCYALSVRHPLMVVGTADRNLIVFNLQNPQSEFKRVISPLKYQTRCVAAFPDQQGFLVGSIEGRVGVHHLDESQSSKNFTFKCHRDGNDVFSVNSLEFHPIHHTFATAGSDGAFNFWDKDSKQRLKAMQRCNQPIPCSTFNNDGSIYAYSVCYDWSKGAENHNPSTAKTYIYLHMPQEVEVKGKPRAGAGGRK